MKKIILAICMCSLAVTAGFAKDIVKTLDDRFDVCARYLLVDGYSEEVSKEFIRALFAKFGKTRYDATKNVMSLSCKDIFSVGYKEIIQDDSRLVNYVFGVLENAIEQKSVEANLRNPIKINPEYKDVDLTKFTKECGPSDRMCLCFITAYAEEMENKYCQDGELKIVKDSHNALVTCDGRNYLKYAEQHENKQVSIEFAFLFNYYPRSIKVSSGSYKCSWPQ